jgi:hypothetical protein
MGSTIFNPYGDGGAWMKGNLHAHTTNSDGARTPQQQVDAYAGRGYDFLMLSDHDVLTDVNTLDPHGMVLIPGYEVTARGPHILHVNASKVVQPDPNRQRVFDEVRTDGGFAIVNHPNWEYHFEHCPQELLETWRGYAGIEIYNGVVRRQEGSPLATDRWDRLLSSGRRVWGFANDDNHAPCDDGIAWNVALSKRRDRAAVVQALRRGSFYASTGVEIRGIEVEGETIRVGTENAQRIVVSADYGLRLDAVDSDFIEFRLGDYLPVRYVRFECWGPGERMAWTQPFFIE